MESPAYSNDPDDVFFSEPESVGEAAPMEPGLYDETGTNYDTASTTTETSAERMVIKNADLAIIAEAPEESMQDIGEMAEKMGGFVVESNLYQQTLSSGARVPQASITVRVPAEKLDEALEQIKAGALDIDRENKFGQDVTGQYTDLQSQLRNLEAAEAQLQEIMDNASDTDDVLNIFNQLVNIRGQIEVIKGQMQYYEQSAKLSKISVSITADEAARPLQVGGWRPSGVAKDAIETLIKTLQFLVNMGIWVVLCVLPIGLLIGLPLYFIVRAALRARKRRKEQPAPEVNSPKK
jgi:hypothetical protein